MLFLVLFFLVLVLLLFFEFAIHKTFMTPFSILSVIYLILIPLNNFWAHKKYGFMLITNETIIKLLICLIIVFCSSVFTTLFFYNKENKFHQSHSDNRILILKKQKTIKTLFYIGLFSKYLSLILAISKYGVLEIKGKDGGVFAHIGNLAVIFLPLLLVVCIENNKIRMFIIPFVLLFFNFLIFGGKYVILINLTYLLFFYSYIYKISFFKKLKITLSLLISSLFVFFFLYVVKPLFELGYYSREHFQRNSEFALKHFFYYMLSPVIAMNDFFNNNTMLGEGIKIVFMVPINLFVAFFGVGKQVTPQIEQRPYISAEYTTNVGGFFSESIMFLGEMVGGIYIFIVFTCIYVFIWKTRKDGKFILTTTYLLSVTIFLFFSNFFTLSGIILVIVGIIIVELLLNKKNKEVLMK